MTQEKKNKAKATAEAVREYDELDARLQKIQEPWNSEEASLIQRRINELEEQFDWFNVEFTDPVTGKKGMRTVAGTTVVPAIYDGFVEFRSYLHSPNALTIAYKGDKCAIVRGDGSGTPLCDFTFDQILTYPYSTLFIASWGGVKDRIGFITARGDVICPNILTGYEDMPFNGIVPIVSGGKCGVIDIETYQCVLPEYDDLDLDAEPTVVFIKDGQRGYVTEKGEFITIEQYDDDERYWNEDLVSTHL